MHLIILKNNSDIIGRLEDITESATYSMIQFESIPDYPEEDAGFGKEWKLIYNAEDNTLSWVLSDRELTVEEKLIQLEDAKNGLNILGVKND